MKVIEAVPDTWINKKNDYVYWPTHNQITKRRDEFSTVDMHNSIPYECKLLLEGCKTLEEADKLANEYQPTFSDVEAPKKIVAEFIMDDDVCMNLMQSPVC